MLNFAFYAQNAGQVLATPAATLGVTSGVPALRYLEVSDIPALPLSKISQSGATDGQVPKWDDATEAWIPADDATGSGSGAGTVIVEEADGFPSITASKIIFPNGTLADSGGGVATITVSGGSGGGSSGNPVFMVDTASDQVGMSPAPNSSVRGTGNATFIDTVAGNANGIYYGGGWTDYSYPMDATNAALFYCNANNILVRFAFYSPYSGTFRLLLDHHTNFNMVNATYTADGTTNVGNTMIGAKNTPPTNTFVRDFDTGVDVTLTRGLNIVRFRVSGVGTYDGADHNYLAIKRLVFVP